MSCVPTARLLRHGSALQLVRYRCCAPRGARPFDEEHAWPSISLVERGVFGVQGTAGRAVLGPGWLMLGNAGDGYACSHEHGDGTGDDCLALRLSEESLEPIGRFPRVALPPVPRVAALLQGALQDEVPLEVLALEVVADVVQALSERPPAARASHRAKALQAARHIEEHATEPLSLDELAQSVGTSTFHFLRVFRDALGVTPHQYLIRVRLLRALSLLHDPSLQVTEIAQLAGWNDLSNFIRTFRREIGCSPRAYRQGGPLGAPIGSSSATGLALTAPCTSPQPQPRCPCAGSTRPPSPSRWP
jgi:AraC family transcriptional regulator